MKGNIAVIDRLRDTAGVYNLIGGAGTLARVKPMFAAQASVFPRVIVELTDSQPVDSKSGASEMDVDFVSVMSEAQTATDARALADQVREALNWITGTFNDIYCTRIRYVNESDYSERMQDNTIYGIEQNFEVITYVT
jgi:hypothetical protein